MVEEKSHKNGSSNVQKVIIIINRDKCKNSMEKTVTTMNSEKKINTLLK